MEKQTEPRTEKSRAEPKKAKLTRPFVKKLRRNPPTETETWWHTGLAGFGVTVDPTGEIRYPVRYCIGRGRQGRVQRQLTLPGTLPPDQAERRARVIQNDALKGHDPLQQRRGAAKATKPSTYEAIVGRFIEEYAKPRQRTWDQTERVLRGPKKDPHPWLKAQFGQITRAQIKPRLQKFVNDGQPYKANVLKAWLRKLFRWATEEEIVPSHFMDSLKLEFEKRERDRVYSDAEIKAIWHAANQLSHEEATYVKLIMLLAPRKTALAAMAGTDLDSATDPSLWTTPFELTKSRKTSNKKRVYLVPLSPLCQRLFKGVAKDGRVFASLPIHTTRAGRPTFYGVDLKARLVAHGAPADFQFHAWRHTIATWFEDRGMDEWETGLLLNHSGSGSVTAGYRHGYPLELKRKLLTEWSEHIEQLVQPEEGATMLR